MNRADVVRTFIALETPENLRHQIRMLQSQLRGISGARISWVRSEGIHLTLKFLGDVERTELIGIEKALTDVAGGHSPVDLTSTMFGGFPNLRRPRVLWLGLDGGEQLINLQKDIDSSLTDFGFEREGKRYHPHLTIGRVKSIELDSRLIQCFRDSVLQPYNWTADSIRLMSSVLKPTGAEYGILADITLKC